MGRATKQRAEAVNGVIERGRIAVREVSKDDLPRSLRRAAVSLFTDMTIERIRDLKPSADVERALDKRKK